MPYAIGMGIGIPFKTSVGGVSWSPGSNWFSSGEIGAWYDPPDLTRYMSVTDSPELVAPIDLQTGWTTSGAAVTFNSATSYTAAGVANVFRNYLMVGRTYLSTANISFTAGAVGIYNASNATNQMNPLGFTSGVSQTFAYAALSTQINLRPTTAATVTINSITVKEVLGIASATLWQDSAGTATPVLTVAQQVGNINDRSGNANHATQATSAARPTLQSDSGYIGLGFLGTDDSLAAAAGGGTTGGTWVFGLRLVTGGSAQTVWSDAGTNTGYRIRINSSNQIEFSAGNGSAYTTATVATALTVGDRCVVTCWHDGATLSAQVNNGTIATAVMGTVTAGTAAFTLGKTNGAASEFFIGRVYEAIYVRNEAKTDLTAAKIYAANRSGVTL